MGSRSRELVLLGFPRPTKRDMSRPPHIYECGENLPLLDLEVMDDKGTSSGLQVCYTNY